MSRSSTLDLESLWSESLEGVMPTVSSPAQRQWLAATRPVGFNDDTVVLASPHSFAREWLDTRCGDRIRAALSRAAGRELAVVITVQPRPEPLADAAAHVPAAADHESDTALPVANVLEHRPGCRCMMRKFV